MAIKIINKVGQYQTIYYYDYGISLTKNNSGNKYCHYTRIYNSIGKKKAIVIGMNPGRQYNYSMDKTNVNIVNILRDSGYN